MNYITIDDEIISVDHVLDYYAEYKNIITNEQFDMIIRDNADFIIYNYHLFKDRLTDEQFDYLIHKCPVGVYMGSDFIEQTTKSQFDHILQYDAHSVLINYDVFGKHLTDEQFDHCVKQHPESILYNYSVFKKRVTDEQFDYCIQNAPIPAFYHYENISLNKLQVMYCLYKSVTVFINHSSLSTDCCEKISLINNYLE